MSSWGDCEKFPDVYARVTTARDWIKKQAPGVQHSDCGNKEKVKLKNKSRSVPVHAKTEDLLLDLMIDNEKEPSKILLVKKKNKKVSQ